MSAPKMTGRLIVVGHERVFGVGLIGDTVPPAGTCLGVVDEKPVHPHAVKEVQLSALRSRKKSYQTGMNVIASAEIRCIRNGCRIGTVARPREMIAVPFMSSMLKQ